MTTSYRIGLELGQAQDYTALAVVERAETDDPGAPDGIHRMHAVRYLRRWPPSGRR